MGILIHMALGEVPKDFEALPHSSTRLVGNETLRRTNRTRLHMPKEVEMPGTEAHNESLARRIIEKLGVGRLMRGGSARG